MNYAKRLGLYCEGHRFYLAHQFANARDSFGRLYRVHPDFKQVALYYANSLNFLGQTYEAYVIMHAAWEKSDHSDPVMAAGYSSILAKLGKWEEFLFLCEFALEHRPDITYCMVNMGTACEHQGLHLEALTWYLRAALQESDCADYQLFAAEAYARIGNYTQAMHYAQLCLKLNPDCKEALELQASCSHELYEMRYEFSSDDGKRLIN